MKHLNWHLLEFESKREKKGEREKETETACLFVCLCKISIFPVRIVMLLQKDEKESQI